MTVHNCSSEIYCSCCHERLVHQDARSNESHSKILQYVRKLKRVAYLGDIDYYSVSRSNRLLRVIDYKKPNESSLTKGERLFMGIIADAISIQIEEGTLHPQSGCFQLRSPDTFDKGSLQQVEPFAAYLSDGLMEPELKQLFTKPPLHLNKDEMTTVIQGEPL